MPKTFKTDVPALRRRLDARAASMRLERGPHEAVWRELASHFEPRFGRPLTDGTDAAPHDSYSSMRDDKIINSTPRTALSRLGSGMQGGITSPSNQWFRLTVDTPDLAERPEIKVWLDDCTRRMAAAFSASNIYTALHQMYRHLGCFGTSAAIVVPDPESGLRAILLDEGSYWLASNNRGRINRLMRQFSITASQIVDEFGHDAAIAHTAVKDAIGRGANETYFTVCHLIEPHNPAAEPKIADIDSTAKFSSVYWLRGAPADQLLAIRPFKYNPILAPRWDILAGSYGTGPGHVALSDAKELQRLETDLLAAIAKSVNPPLTAPDSMRDEPINAFPGGITFRQDGGIDPDRRPSLAPLYEMRISTADIRAQIDAVERRIERTFFSDLFAMMLNLNARPKVMTAREVVELSQEKMSLLGPVLTAMNTDLLDPLIDAAFSILYEAGRLPPAPETLSGVPLSVRYVSVLHTEQQSTSRLGSMIRLMDFVGMIAQADPSCIDKIDATQAIDEAADVLAVPGRVIRSDADVAGLRKSRAEAQQQAQMAASMAAAAPAARAARDLSETRLGGNSALDAINQTIIAGAQTP